MGFSFLWGLYTVQNLLSVTCAMIRDIEVLEMQKLKTFPANCQCGGIANICTHINNYLRPTCLSF